MTRYAQRAVAALGTVALSPVFLCVAVATKIDSEGPVFFRQERVGKDGVPFRIHKFRTMTNSVPRVNVSAAGDPRVTRVGRILRKTKLDELPQLIDIAQGTMAFVGPRPEVPEYVAQWPQEARPIILSVLPGVTDPASIQFRNEADILAEVDDPETYYVETLLPQKARAYVDYVQNRSFVGDLKIIAQTLKTVILD